MKQYKEEMDALHASDTLRETIAALPQNVRPTKRTPVKRIAVIAAALAVVLVAGIASTPLLFSAQKSADRAEYGYETDSNYQSLSSRNAAQAEDMAQDLESGLVKTADTSASPVLPSGRKLIRNAELSVQTKAFDTFHAAVLQKVAAIGGYVEASDSGAFSTLRYENLTLRIPADALDSFLDAVAALGTVTSQETSVLDVTDKYIDVKSRLAALETEQTTLLSLLEKAENLTEILEIQDRLTEVRGSLESYKAQLQALDSQIDYSTVTMVVNEVERITPQEQKGFFSELRQNLSENLYSIGQGARNFALWFLSSLPYILLWAVLIGAVIGVILLMRRRRRKKD